MHEITLWKNNRLDQKYQLSVADAARQFRDTLWYKYYTDGFWPYSRSLAAFLGSPEADKGLSSTWERPDFDAFADAVYAALS